MVSMHLVNGVLDAVHPDMVCAIDIRRRVHIVRLGDEVHVSIHCPASGGRFGEEDGRMVAAEEQRIHLGWIRIGHGGQERRWIGVRSPLSGLKVQVVKAIVEKPVRNLRQPRGHGQGVAIGLCVTNALGNAVPVQMPIGIREAVGSEDRDPVILGVRRSIKVHIYGPFGGAYHPGTTRGRTLADVNPGMHVGSPRIILLVFSAAVAERMVGVHGLYRPSKQAPHVCAHEQNKDQRRQNACRPDAGAYT